LPKSHSRTINCVRTLRARASWPRRKQQEHQCDAEHDGAGCGVADQWADRECNYERRDLSQGFIGKAHGVSRHQPDDLISARCSTAREKDRNCNVSPLRASGRVHNLDGVRLALFTGERK
jgi:hypothetical protein